MAEHKLIRKLKLARPVKETFEFFSDAENLELITPPELNFKITTPRPFEIKKGTIIEYQLKLRGIPVNWKTEISAWDPPFSFVDQALKSPYKQWIHRHSFRETESGGTEMEDRVEYRLPFEPFGDLMHWYVSWELDYIFDFRQKAVSELLGVGS